MKVPDQKFDIGRYIPDGSKVDDFHFKTPEDVDDKAARLIRESWSFLVERLAVYVFGYMFLTVISAYCSYVIASHGAVSPEGKAVLPLLTTLFGGVLGVIVGKAAK